MCEQLAQDRYVNRSVVIHVIRYMDYGVKA